MKQFPRSLISTFGDSFTHCDQVNHNQTFQHHLSRMISANVLNFGSGGYGTDQAYLRFKRDYPKVKTPIVTLGLVTENINRIVNVYRPFYFKRTQLSLTKPRFHYKDGEWVFLPNPTDSIDAVEKLQSPFYVMNLGKHDWWYNKDEYPVYAFPYATMLLNKRLWLEAIYGKAGRVVDGVDPRPWANLWEDEEASSLMFFLIDSFVQEAEKLSAKPLIMLFPRRGEVLMRREGIASPKASKLLSYCLEKGYTCFDGITALAKSSKSSQFARTLFDKHLTSAGNKVLARRFFEFLQSEQLLPNDSGSRKVPFTNWKHS